MSKFRELMINQISNDEIWTKIEDLFDKFLSDNERVNKIPKKIHQVWLGGSIPKSYDRIIQSWKDKNPDWEYKLWTDDDVENFNMINIDKFNSAKNLGAKSDIFRYEILYRHGGLYIDTDFECLKSFNDFIHLDFFTGTGHISEPEIFNGLFACTQNHRFLKRLIDNLAAIANTDYENIMNTTGPRFFSKNFFEYMYETDEKIVVFPTTFFYPFPAIYRYMVREDNTESRNLVSRFNSNNSYCTHLWYTSWQK